MALPSPVGAWAPRSGRGPRGPALGPAAEPSAMHSSGLGRWPPLPAWASIPSSVGSPSGTGLPQPERAGSMARTRSVALPCAVVALVACAALHQAFVGIPGEAGLSKVALRAEPVAAAAAGGAKAVAGAAAAGGAKAAAAGAAGAAGGKAAGLGAAGAAGAAALGGKGTKESPAAVAVANREIDFLPDTYVNIMTIAFFGSVLANSNGFFAPW
ncbi:unnamed protein product [Prorocentrum cordatum]|uniref:PSI-J n=1 Tax=Prorocentrum cordatum TaxID=2364126 RepID=A0ABN9WTM3_9DINO|nr:unnamed protein product [Polarella glacialis]